MRHHLPILLGPAITGLILGLSEGPEIAALRALLLTLVILGCALMMLPPLYIATSLTQEAPPLHDFIRSGHLTLSHTGRLMLGLSPALLFLVSTTTSPTAVLVLGHLTVALTLVLALKSLFHTLFPEPSETLPGIFIAWSLLTLGIGEHLFLQLFV